MLLPSIVFSLLITDALAVVGINTEEWWRDKFIYQIYPRSFKDSNGDGVGDLRGITSKLEHLADLKVGALWISPIYKSPMADFGYDISNFTEIDPTFGTLEDFTELTAKAKSLGLKVLLDFVPNHSSNEHPWFVKSVNRIKPYDEYYIWNDGRMINGTRQPPNNWLSQFDGPAWRWNAQRRQYYLHQFVWQQPDLNYRSPALRAEMKNALSFWLNRGVDGFRIDAINYLFEDSRLLDEPKTNITGLPAGDYATLDHIYTKNLDDTYEVLKSWRQLVDDHARNINSTDKIILLTESYSDMNSTMKYYPAGSNVPFNFMLMADINNKSLNIDWKRVIDGWVNAMPDGYSANWVTGNHDQRRAATRFGNQRTDQLTMIAAVLPGPAIIYNGDEIGMEDYELSFQDTVDPWGCNAGPDRYNLKSRDPERTPFQWDASASAGFSSNPKTWLPVNPNYRTLNLAAQRNVPTSHYSVTKKLIALKKLSLLRNASTEIVAVGSNLIGFVRRPRVGTPVVLVVNLSDSRQIVDARSWLNIPEKMAAIIGSSTWKMSPGAIVNTAALELPAAASVIMTSQQVAFELSN